MPRLGEARRFVLPAILAWSLLLGLTAGCASASAPSVCSRSAANCGRLLLRADGNDPPVKTLHAGLTSTRGPVATVSVIPNETNARLAAPAGHYTLQLAVQPCASFFCTSGHSAAPVSCQRHIQMRADQAISAFLILNPGGCVIRTTRGLGPTVAVDPDKSIARVTLGQTSTHINAIYGPGRSHVHPAFRVYDIAHQAVHAQFDHFEHAINLESTGPALTLDGQRLSRGWAYWQPRLAARGWHTKICPHTPYAISPGRRTSLLIEANRITVDMTNDHYDAPFPLTCDKRQP